MTKRIAKQLNTFKYKNQPLKFNLATLALIAFCSFLIVISTFLQFDFTHYIIPADVFSYIGDDFSNPEIKAHFLKTCRYIPQIPVVMFVVALLGRRFGLASIFIYILVGLFLAPIFALGGGIKYVLSYGFGYILAYIPAVFFAGSILKSGLTYRNMTQATLVGVLTIHIIGMLYMLFMATIQGESSALILGWISAQSGAKILYDLLFSFLAMILAMITKKVFWYALY